MTTDEIEPQTAPATGSFPAFPDDWSFGEIAGFTAHVAKVEAAYPQILIRIICDDMKQRRKLLESPALLGIVAGGDQVQRAIVDDLPAVFIRLTCDDDEHREEMLDTFKTEEGNMD